MHPSSLRFPTRILKPLLVAAVFAIVLTSLAFAGELSTPAPQASPLHPTFALLDSSGQNVLETGEPVSTMNTCGSCHDAAFIADHSFHATAGLNDLADPGTTGSGRAWDTSPGYFGRWSPITYRYLSPPGDERVDLTTAEWIMAFGARHAGGGPAEVSRDGTTPLEGLLAEDSNPETTILDPQTGNLSPWDWAASGGVEMNCFLCHLESPNNDARVAALEAGQFRWANTATLEGSGLVQKVGDAWQWNAGVFQQNGELAPEFVTVQDPDNENCGQCHGLVHDDPTAVLVQDSCETGAWETLTTGQINSSERISNSGMNLEDKAELTRSWDIHAERLVQCVDCHYSLNNPVFYQEGPDSRPDHLVFDPRRLDLGDYLYQPLHQFARGESAQGTIAPELRDTMRRCESCHDPGSSHDWLPYQERHLNELSCETCHIPKLYGSAYQRLDWTVLQANGSPASECRGVAGDDIQSIETLVTGYEPVLLQRESVEGNTALAPYNLLAAWFWVYDQPPRPVRQVDLQAAFLEGDGYHPDVVAAFDTNGSGQIETAELVIDDPSKEAVIRSRLESLGLSSVRINGEIQPFSINHNVAGGEWAIRDCQACHSESSRLTRPFLLAEAIPGDVLPEFVSDSNAVASGDLYRKDGALYYQPVPVEDGLYILGRDRVGWVDWTGVGLFLMTLTGAAVHGGLRFFTSLQADRREPEIKRVYMYSVYDRLWHWLQTFAILLLAVTGLIIHKPDMFGIFSFRYVVLVHNILGFVLLANALLALFYALASGEIRRFLPRPRGFFAQTVAQTQYYLHGIFKGEEHPFAKTRAQRLNPLQKITYFGILNVLLPLQVITGVLMWGANRWPAAALRLGGLPFLGPFHTLIAWLFVSFILMHIYLTTTGHTPLANIRSMIVGWDEVDVHTPAPEGLD